MPPSPCAGKALRARIGGRGQAPPLRRRTDVGAGRRATQGRPYGRETDVGESLNGDRGTFMQFRIPHFEIRIIPCGVFM